MTAYWLGVATPFAIALVLGVLYLACDFIACTDVSLENWKPERKRRVKHCRGNPYRFTPSMTIVSVPFTATRCVVVRWP